MREHQLSVKISLDTERIMATIRRFKARSGNPEAAELLFEACTDGLKRLLLPSIEREVHRELKERSDRQAVSVFEANLRQLLMTPPVTGRTILGVDPAFRTGCKLAVIDPQGTFVGQEEYPDLDVTVRGAISIAQRLRDPMAELVKIDPKSLGIGQYQHDVDQKLLERRLETSLEDVVNRAGVEVNSASAALFSYLAGITPRLARALVVHRQERERFTGKTDLLQVKGRGSKGGITKGDQNTPFFAYYFD